MASIPRCGFTLVRPTYFVFELIDNRSARESRYRELVRQHGPICNVEEVNRE